MSSYFFQANIYENINLDYIPYCFVCFPPTIVHIYMSNEQHISNMITGSSNAKSIDNIKHKKKIHLFCATICKLIKVITSRIELTKQACVRALQQIGK